MDDPTGAADMGKRPEARTTARLAYLGGSASSYARSSRARDVQFRLAERALELLALPKDRRSLLLDLGCGTGMSGEVLRSAGHSWIGLDLSLDMLRIARDLSERDVDARDRRVSGSERIVPGSSSRESSFEEGTEPLATDAIDADAEGSDSEGDDVEREEEAPQVALADLGHGLPFRPGSFDGAISISALQWLCTSESSSQDPRKRIAAFFRSLYGCLRRGSRAVLQFYPDGPSQAQLLTSAAMRVGFGGGLLVDYPNSAKAKKYYLVLTCGPSRTDQAMPTALAEDEEAGADGEDRVDVHERKRSKKRGRGSEFQSGGGSKRHPDQKGKAWVLHKKELYRQRGRMGIPHDSKYTARKRKRLPT